MAGRLAVVGPEGVEVIEDAARFTSIPCFDVAATAPQAYVPPNTHGNSAKAKDEAPGQKKKDDVKKSHLSYIRARAAERQSHQGKFIGGPGVFGPTSHVPPPLVGPPINRPRTRIIHRS